MMVIWLIGLSGSGKTTLGREMVKQWKHVSPNTVLIDGDEIRHIFSHDKHNDCYSTEGRRINAERITSLCEFLDKQNINVVCCILSIFPEMRANNHNRFSHYTEIFMDASMETLQKRDVKGIYAAALNGKMPNVVGIDIPFERPANPDIIINTTTPTTDIPTLAAKTLSKLGIV